ncbi:MAG TPA: UDP-N-acetylglucosamine--N-acetylmuramyl-(pentapeptide) pyrophosphoryl-undecaprenol N-acetylglucosamine transferase [Gemmatimonadaceae bacterium]|nr:UDP-N-acetylglucosamine--N-acetylmuramyl-(pentapeptide) pyrophosphoryl-undecaprenol N-acetylglucosamine transferase [Gemmatimonadaceae bacterium]
MRIFFTGGGTGGHLYPALAIARAVVALDPSVTPFFVGAKRGVEREILPATEFEHVLLDLHPLYRSRPWKSWRTVAGLAGAWSVLSDVARRERPALVLGTGGYASGAALAWGVRHRVPIALQEQNSHPGITTRIFSRYAREIYLGYDEARSLLRPRADAWVGDTGNPIEQPPVPRPDRGAARARWGFPPSGGNVLLVVGGSQGARALNEAMAGWVRGSLPRDLFIIWGTGRQHHERYAELDSEHVRVLPYLSPIADAYAASDIALTRAGALTLAELCAWGIAPIVVPLPTAAADHQTYNAAALADAGAGVHLSQAALTVETLGAEVMALLQDHERLERISNAALSRARPDAAKTIARRVLELSARTATDAR